MTNKNHAQRCTLCFAVLLFFSHIAQAQVEYNTASRQDYITIGDNSALDYGLTTNVDSTYTVSFQARAGGHYFIVSYKSGIKRVKAATVNSDLFVKDMVPLGDSVFVGGYLVVNGMQKGIVGRLSLAAFMVNDELAFSYREMPQLRSVDKLVAYRGDANTMTVALATRQDGTPCQMGFECDFGPYTPYKINDICNNYKLYDLAASEHYIWFVGTTQNRDSVVVSMDEKSFSLENYWTLGRYVSHPLYNPGEWAFNMVATALDGDSMALAYPYGSFDEPQLMIETYIRFHYSVEWLLSCQQKHLPIGKKDFPHDVAWTENAQRLALLMECGDGTRNIALAYPYACADYIDSCWNIGYDEVTTIARQAPERVVAGNGRQEYYQGTDYMVWGESCFTNSGHLVQDYYLYNYLPYQYCRPTILTFTDGGNTHYIRTYYKDKEVEYECEKTMFQITPFAEGDETE